MTSLEGRRIVVTREEPGEGPLSRALLESGAVPLVAPTVEVVALHDSDERRDLLPPLDAVDWLVVTSPRTVDLLADAGVFDGPPPAGLRVAAAGARTGAHLAAVGWPADRIPEAAGAEPLLQTFLSSLEGERAPGLGPGSRVLFPASAQAGTALPRGLEDAGFDVVRIDLYAPRPVPQDPVWWREQVRDGVDALTFTSPSAVDGLTRGLEDAAVLATLRERPAGVQGPTTARAARHAGWAEVVEARPRTFEGLVDALGAWFPDPGPSLPTLDRLRP
jgi:uroporphyrinogen-III synthase